MNFQNRDPGVQVGADPQMFIPVQWPSYDAVVVFYADSGLGQRRAVRRLEGAEILRTDLDAAVASQQFGIEEYASFGS